MFKLGTIKRYVEHMLKIHGANRTTRAFIKQQIAYVKAGVRDIRLGDDAIILIDGLRRGYNG